jgi:hypothetical protein
MFSFALIVLLIIVCKDTYRLLQHSILYISFSKPMFIINFLLISFASSFVSIVKICEPEEARIALFLRFFSLLVI